MAPSRLETAGFDPIRILTIFTMEQLLSDWSDFAERGKTEDYSAITNAIHTTDTKQLFDAKSSAECPVSSL